MRSYFECIELICHVLGALHIPYTVNMLYRGWQLCFPWCEGNIAVHAGIYGVPRGMVESYCLPWDGNDVTVLTPEEAAIKIIALYNEEMI